MHHKQILRSIHPNDTKHQRGALRFWIDVNVIKIINFIGLKQKSHRVRLNNENSGFLIRIFSKFFNWLIFLWIMRFGQFIYFDTHYQIKPKIVVAYPTYNAKWLRWVTFSIVFRAHVLRLIMTLKFFYLDSLYYAFNISFPVW